METIRVNQTPVRTSENYQMNDFALPHYSFKEVAPFQSYTLEAFEEKIIQPLKITTGTSLTYGNGEEAEKQVNQQANVSLMIDFTKDSSKENCLHYLLKEEAPTLIENVMIHVRENCHAKVTFYYESDYTNHEGSLAFYHNGIIKTHLEKNAQLTCQIVNLLEENTTHLLAIENSLEENAKLTVDIVDFGGNSSVTNYYTNLIGDYAENTLNTIYLGRHRQVFDMNYIVAARGKNTRVNMNVQGAMKDDCQKHFKGTIDFKRGCQKAEGNESEFCMLLSDKAKAISLPMLLCDEEDVVGNHATAAGKVDKKELFYLMSRGLTEEEAKTLLVMARFHPVMDHLENPEIKNKVECLVHQKLETEEMCQIGATRDCPRNRE